MAKAPTSELVTAAWLATIPGLDASFIETELPRAVPGWTATGWVQVGPGFRGSPGMYVPVREPVMELHFFAAHVNDNLPDWEKAFDLAELVINATYDNLSLNTALTMPRAGYRAARVLGAWPMDEPQRNRQDAAEYADVFVDVIIRWIEIPESEESP